MMASNFCAHSNIFTCYFTIQNSIAFLTVQNQDFQKVKIYSIFSRYYFSLAAHVKNAALIREFSISPDFNPQNPLFLIGYSY